MNPLVRRNSLIALAMLIGFVLACSGSLGDETAQANKLVNEANALIQEGNKLSTDASAKNDKVFNELKPATFDEDKERLKGAAQEAVDGFSKSAQKFRDAAKKFEEASKLKINDKFKEYLQLKTQEFNKNAEQMETAGLMPKAVLDSPDAETLSQKIKENKERYDKLEKEAKELSDKAEKVRAENKDKFEPNSNK